MPDAAGYRYAELHLHLGGAILPRVLWSYLQRERTESPDGEFAKDSQAVVDEFGEYAAFERFLTRDCSSLTEYLEAHKRVEPLQKVESLPYYVYRLLRGRGGVREHRLHGASLQPLFPNPEGHAAGRQVRARMEEVVSTVAAAARNAQRRFPIALTQILCLDSRLSERAQRPDSSILRATCRTRCARSTSRGRTSRMPLGRPTSCGRSRTAKSKGLKTTAHLYETPEGAMPELLPLLGLHRARHPDSAGMHRSLLVAIAGRGQCLEVCPTTYLRTGTLSSYAELHPGL